MATPTPEQFFSFDPDAYDTFQGSVRDIRDERFFQRVFVTPRGLLTMVKHSLTTHCEILGILTGQGTPDGSFFLVNAVPFNVEGTETRVGATNDAWIDFMEYRDAVIALGHTEVAAGWYHSHPSYSPYLSEIDVLTQRLNQLGYNAFVALVIDPIKTVSSGKVQLGAYRTFAENPVRDSEPVPGDLLEKYGSAAHKYYELDIVYYTTQLDLTVLSDITTKSYGQAIASSPLQLIAKYVASKFVDAGQTMMKTGTTAERPGDIEGVVKVVQRVNEDRRTGLWVARMKRAAFG
jgi:COP9 signalosome complex subunit 5